MSKVPQSDKHESFLPDDTIRFDGHTWPDIPKVLKITSI